MNFTTSFQLESDRHFAHFALINYYSIKLIHILLIASDSIGARANAERKKNSAPKATVEIFPEIRYFPLI